MAKRCSLYAILLLSFTLGAMVAMVVGDKCKEDLGNLGVCPSEDACKSRCSQIHGGGEGICEANSEGGNHCICYFECVKCEDVLPYLGCDDSKCTSDCVAKHPNRRATGYCENFGGQPNSICHCQFNCP